MSLTHRIHSVALWTPLFLLIFFVSFAERAHSAPVLPSTLTGWLTVQWADPERGQSSLLPHVQRAQIVDDQGKVTEIVLDERADAPGGLSRYSGKRVSVTLSQSAAQAMPSAAPSPGGDAPARAAMVRFAGQASGLQANGQQAAPPPPGESGAQGITGPQPWVNILCRFSDSTSTTPHPKSWFDTLMGDTSPGLNHYWKETSYDNVNITGTIVAANPNDASGWYNLPHPRSYYVTKNAQNQDVADLTKLATDCTGVADAEVNFPTYVGVNLMFNGDLDGFAWGGTYFLNRDGQGKVYRMTWLPTWGYENQGVTAHEMGHGFGLPHSSGPYTATYDSAWDPMSNIWYCGNSNATYGCVGVNTISYHKDLLGWIPSSARYVPGTTSDKTITIDQLGAPFPGGTDHYHMAKIPIPGTSNVLYTVETRRKVGYDIGIPGNAVIIHKVDVTRSDRDAQVVDGDTGNTNPNDAGAMWLPGETFTDAASGITVSVLSGDSTSYQVRIQTVAVSAPTNDDFDSATTISSLPYSKTQATITATTASDDPVLSDCLSQTHSKSVWFKYTQGASSAVLNLTTSGSDYDTVLAAWSGTRGNLTSLGCNDDETPGSIQTSKMSFTAAANTTYYIEALSFGSTSGGNLTLAVSQQAVASTVPFYRIWAAGIGDHFYTANNAERQAALQTAGYLDEGVCCSLYTTQVAGTVPLYRLAGAGWGDHFYTANPAEKDSAQQYYGYIYEGIAGYCYSPTQPQPPNTEPLYRLASFKELDHFYTTSATERDQFRDQDSWNQDEGIACYMPISSTTPSMPVYRMSSASAGDHFYTTSPWERDYVKKNSGYSFEGICCSLYPSQVAGTVPLYRVWSTSLGDHAYTTSSTERDQWTQSGYTSQGVAGYCYPARGGQTQPPNTNALYRLWGSAAKDHLYTTSTVELNVAQQYGYTSEGTECYTPLAN